MLLDLNLPFMWKMQPTPKAQRNCHVKAYREIIIKWISQKQKYWVFLQTNNESRSCLRQIRSWLFTHEHAVSGADMNCHCQLSCGINHVCAHSQGQIQSQLSRCCQFMFFTLEWHQSSTEPSCLALQMSGGTLKSHCYCVCSDSTCYEFLKVPPKFL